VKNLTLQREKRGPTKEGDQLGKKEETIFFRGWIYILQQEGGVGRKWGYETEEIVFFCTEFADKETKGGPFGGGSRSNSFKKKFPRFRKEGGGLLRKEEVLLARPRIL